MKKINVAVIGLGNMGRHHVRNYFELDEADLIAVCDFDEEKVNTFSEKYQCEGYTSLDDLLKNKQIDAVTITASTSAHFNIAHKVISQGKHVFIEKPICDNVEDADNLISLADKMKVVLMVGHIERFNPAIQALKKVLNEGRLGKVLSLISRRVGAFPPQIKDANVVIDLAVHDIDIFNYLFDEEPSSVSGNAGRALIDGREDYAELFLNYGDKSGFIQVNWITPIRVRQLSVTGTKGYAELDYIKQELHFYESKYENIIDSQGDKSIKFEEADKHEIEFEKKEPLKEQLTHFLNCIAKKSQPLVHGSVGRQALKIALDSMSKMNMNYELKK